MEARTYELDKKKPKSRLVLTLVFIFFGITGFLVYTSFFNPELGESLTGKVIKNNQQKTTVEDAADIYAVLESPSRLELKPIATKLSIRIEKQTNFYVGNQKIEIPDKASIILDDFDGEIKIESKTIKELEGKSSKILVDGLPITQKSGSNNNINLEPNTPFEFLQITDFFISSLSYTTSGKININQDKIIITLDKEEFRIKDFKGNMDLTKNNLKLNGVIEKENVDKILGSIYKKQLEVSEK